MSRDDIKNAGLKVTKPRLRILAMLEKTRSYHLTAERIHQDLLGAGEGVSLATVYRVLLDFEKAGLVTRHQFNDGHAVFELDRGKHHDHLVCLDCGKVTEFHNAAIERQQQAIAAKMGFEVGRHALTLYGHCRIRGCKGAKA